MSLIVHSRSLFGGELIGMTLLDLYGARVSPKIFPCIHCVDLTSLTRP